MSFFSLERNLERAGTASGTFCHARLGQILRVEVQEEKEAGGKGARLQNRHSRACVRRNKESK